MLYCDVAVLRPVARLNQFPELSLCEQPLWNAHLGVVVVFWVWRVGKVFRVTGNIGYDDLFPTIDAQLTVGIANVAVTQYSAQGCAYALP